MKIFTKIGNLFFLITFSFAFLFGEQPLITPVEESQNEKITEEDPKKTLEEKSPSLEFPSLIDLNNKTIEKNKMPKYEGLYLFVFNVAMFSTGIAVVKAITGKKV